MTKAKQVGVRLDGALRSQLESLQKTLGDLTLSQVARLLLHRGIQGVKEDARNAARNSEAT